MGKEVFWYNTNMKYFCAVKKDMTRRLGTVFAAVLILLSVCAVPAFGAVPEETGHRSISFIPGQQSTSALVSGQQPASPFAPRQTIENFSKHEIPVASDETGGSRVYATGNNSANHEKAPGPKLSAFMENAGLSHLFSVHTSAVFFSDKEAEACSLTVIHYLHDQDGLKG